MRYLLLLLAALLAGAINSVAGGGTLVTFPALLSAGITPIAANATSTVALVPGSFGAFWGYRAEVGTRDIRLVCLAVPSLLGGLLGAIFLLKAGDSLFIKLVPWLILGATALFMAQEPLRRWTAGDGQPQVPPTQRSFRWLGVMGLQFLIALYGGFFGAGIGIMMLAALGLLRIDSIHRMNAYKNFAAVCINGVASVTFILQQRVHWTLALIMAAGAIAGGYGGAGIAKRIGQRNVRRVVVFIGLTIGITMLVRRYS